MLRGFILAVHVLLAFMIVVLVLLQRGKGAEAGAGFGSGASGTVFGARGTSTLFSRLTAAFAAAFFVTSLALAYVGTRVTAEPSTLLERRAAQAATAPQLQSAPAPVPAPAGQPVSSVPAPAQPAPATAPAPAPSNKP
jgi:preprotein translocase subunit SecG